MMSWPITPGFLAAVRVEQPDVGHPQRMVRDGQIAADAQCERVGDDGRMRDVLLVVEALVAHVVVRVQLADDAVVDRRDRRVGIDHEQVRP